MLRRVRLVFVRGRDLEHTDGHGNNRIAERSKIALQYNVRTAYFRLLRFSRVEEHSGITLAVGLPQNLESFGNK